MEIHDPARGNLWHTYCKETRMVICKLLFSAATPMFFTAFLLSGCTTVKQTDTARTATEQLLLSTAADHALQSANLMLFANQKVFLDATYFDSYDPKYVLGTIRDALSRAGAILEDSASNSDIIIEGRSGALATDTSETFFGIPSFAAPIPLASALQIPEIAFYKSNRQTSTAKIALLAFARDTRRHIYSTGSLDGKSYDNSYRFLFLAWLRTNLPEKQTDEKKRDQYQVWWPQSDEANLPDTNVVRLRLPAPGTNSTAANPPATNGSTTNSPTTNAPVAPPANVNTNGAGTNP
jgi:hypothetical protein